MVLHQKNWFAIYTRPRAEKKLHAQLCEKDIISFLPLRKELKQWSDRKKWIEQPLLPSYLFVQIPPAEQLNVLTTPGAVRYVCFEGRPAAIPEKQILNLRTLLSNRGHDVNVEYADIQQGDCVRVISGPLRGITGEVLHLKGRYRILLRFESLGCCVHAEISTSEIESLTLIDQGQPVLF